VGVLSLFVLVMHGALWVQMKTTDAVNQRSGKLAGTAWWGVLILTAVVTAITFKIQPQVWQNFVTWPWGFVFPLLAVAGIAGVRFELVKRDELKAFFASCAYLTGMLTSVVFGLYPLVLPARNPIYSLSVASAKAGDYGLKVGAVWWAIGILLVTGYFTYVYRSFAGKVAVAKDQTHY
jgi:cytochrome d ubiquinol oxidase subunit II